MSGTVKTITLRTSYEGKLDGLKEDVAKVKAIRRQLEKNPIRLPIKLDLSGLKSEAAKAASEVQKALNANAGKIRPGEKASKGGILIPQSTAKELDNIARRANRAGNALKTVTEFDGAGATGEPKTVTTFRQISKGLKLIEQTNAKGDTKSRVEDTSKVAGLKDQLAQIDREFASKIGGAKSKGGDVAAVLREKKKQIDAALSKFSDIDGSAEMQAAKKAITNLEQQIAQAEGKQQKKKKVDFSKRFNERATSIRSRAEKSLNNKLKENKTEEAIARSIKNRQVRESETNRVLQERSAILERHEKFFRNMAARANKRGQGQAASKFTNAADSIGGQRKQLDLDRTRASSEASMKAREASLKRRIRLTKARDAMERANLANQERQAKALKNRAARERELNRILKARQSINQRSANRFGAIGQSARKSGFTGISEQAAKSQQGVMQRMITDQKTLAGVTRKSGRALNFHTSSLVKNAVTFTKWFVPAQIMMGSFRVINQGIRDAVEAQREFRILNAVFQGSARDAKLVADQSLALAAANSRSASEAAQATIAWSRLGFTRTQVLIATETSMRAANVAEIEAGKATEFLTGTMKGFKLAIADVPEILDFLNALSNKNKVTVTDLFESYAKAGEVVKQAGVEWQEFGAIVTAVSDNSKVSGKEIGNAIKFVAQRLRRPQNLDKLEEEFGVNLRTETGDVKRLTEIFKELAAVFPTLNREQKASLLEMSAGARQANRFALVLDNMTEAHIAQAEASRDTNSAARENEAIMTSLGATLDKLQTSWVRFIHNLGEGGFFDAAVDNLNALMETAREANEVIQNLTDNPRTPRDTRTIDIDSRLRRRDIQRFGQIESNNQVLSAPDIVESMDGFNRDFSPEQIKKAKDNVEDLARAIKLLSENQTSFEKSGITELRVAELKTEGSKLATTPEQKEFIDTITRLFVRGGGTPGERPNSFTEPTAFEAEEDLAKTLNSILSGQPEIEFTGPGAAPNSGSEKFPSAADAINDLETIASDLSKLLNQDQFDKNLDSDTRTARKIVQLQTQLNGIEAARSGFQSIAGLLRTENPDERNIKRLFDKATPELTVLPGQGKNAAEARLKIRPLIEAGKFDEAAKEIDKLAVRLANAFEETEGGFLEKREAAIGKISESADLASLKINELEQDLANTNDPGRQQELGSKIEEANDKLKEQQELLRSLTGSEPELDDDPLSSQAGVNLRQRIKDLKLLGKTFGETFTSLDTGDEFLNAKIKAGAIRQQGDFISQFGTNAGNRLQPELDRLREERDNARAKGRGLTGDAKDANREQVRAIQERIDLISNGLSLIDSEVKKAREATEEAERQLFLERKLLGIREKFSDAQRAANNQSTAFGVGKNETEKLINQTRSNLDFTSQDLDAAKESKGAEQRAAALGALSERLRLSKDGIHKMETRINQLIADRANLEHDITKQQREQREEASKRLSLASREDQLRAAALKRFSDENGGISSEQFQFFNQSSKSAITNFLPDAAPGIHNSEFDDNKRRAEVNEEIRRLNNTIEPMREVFISLREAIRNNAPGIPKPGDVLDPTSGPRGEDETLAAGKDKINLNTGPVNIRIDMTEQVSKLRDLLKTDMNQKLDSALTQMRLEFESREPNTAPALNVD